MAKEQSLRDSRYENHDNYTYTTDRDNANNDDATTAISRTDALKLGAGIDPEKTLVLDYPENWRRSRGFIYRDGPSDMDNTIVSDYARKNAARGLDTELEFSGDDIAKMTQRNKPGVEGFNLSLGEDGEYNEDSAIGHGVFGSFRNNKEEGVTTHNTVQAPYDRSKSDERVAKLQEALYTKRNPEVFRATKFPDSTLSRMSLSDDRAERDLATSHPDAKDEHKAQAAILNMGDS
jgi:hypothetical protein